MLQNYVPDDENTNGRSISKLVFIQCYFVTIATILGSGILGLPVTLVHSGLYPFIVSFLVCLVFQIIVICFMVDILQRSHAVQVGGTEQLLLAEVDTDDDVDRSEGKSRNQEFHGDQPLGREVQKANFHLLGLLFLPQGVRQLFDAIMILQFLAFLISYALAGSEAYAELFNMRDHAALIPPFVWILTLIIVFALQYVQPIISLLTVVKGSLLLGTVVVTFFLGTAIHNEVTNDFSYISSPFLMGTVALGGAMCVMPLMYDRISPVKEQIQLFCGAIVGGVSTCAVLVILWCWAVLEIVPQLSACHLQLSSNSSSGSTKNCLSNTSLESAANAGEISTIPLTRMIHQYYPSYDWVATLVELFIMISITVSYLTIGAAMHHTLCGWVKAKWNHNKWTEFKQKFRTPRIICCFSKECICQSLVSLATFSIVFLVAMLNPQGFIAVLERLGSFVSNILAGFFLTIMIRRSSTGENRKLRVPWQFSSWFYWLQYPMALYFNLAVVYSLFVTLHGLFMPQVPLPWEGSNSQP